MLAFFFGVVNINYWTSYLSVFIDQEYHEKGFGFLVMSQQMSYIMFSIILPKVCKLTPRKLLFMVAFIGFALNQLLLGPAWFWPVVHDNQKYWLIMAAFLFSGCLQVLVVIFILPEIFQRMVCELGICIGQDELLDFALNRSVNNAFQVVQAVAMIASPIIGVELFNYFEKDHSKVANFFFCVDIAVFAILFLFNGDVRVYKENRLFLEKFMQLQYQNDGDIISLRSYKEY